MNPDLPVHYRQSFVLTIRFALIMLNVGLAFGVLYRESTRKLATLEPAYNWAATEHLALVHGHSFVLGVFIPLSVLIIIYFVHVLGGRELRPIPLIIHLKMYIFGAASAVALLVYKGYHFALSFRSGVLDVHQIEQSLFGGCQPIRIALYAGSHVLMGMGLLALAISLWSSLKTVSITGSSD